LDQGRCRSKPTPIDACPAQGATFADWPGERVISDPLLPWHRQVTERSAPGGRDHVARATRGCRVRRSRAIRSSPRNEALDSRMMTMPGEESCGGWRSDRGWRQIAEGVWRI